MDKFEEIFSSRDFGFDPIREVDDIMLESRREALQDALSRVNDLDDCWAVFRQSITETIIDDAVIRQVVVDSRMQVGRAIVESEYDKLVNIAAANLVKKNYAEVMQKAATIVLEDPKKFSEIKHLAVALLKDQLCEKVRDELRESLKVDPVFVDEVKREIKRQIMGL